MAQAQKHERGINVLGDPLGIKTYGDSIEVEAL